MMDTLAVITGSALMSIYEDFEIRTERVFKEFDTTGTRRVGLSL